MNDKPTSQEPQQRVSVQLPGSGSDGPRNLTITLAISIQVTEIPGVSIGLAGVDLKHAGPVVTDVSAVQASMQQQQAAARRSTDDGGTAGKEKKKPNFFSWKKKIQQPAGTAEAGVPEPAPQFTSPPVIPAKVVPPTPSGGGGASEQSQPPLPPLPPLPQPAAAVAPAAPAAAVAPAAPAATARMSIKDNKDKGNSVDDSSDDDEIDMTKTAPDLGRNTVESEAGDTGENTCGSSGGKEKPTGGKKFQLFGRSKKDKGKVNESGNFNFPQDVPDNVKTLFQLMSDTRLIATVYTSNAGRTPAVKKQKALLTESTEKRFTVDGKSRSVWLDPSAGEKVEIWKEYFGDDGDCNRALGRLPGTDKYGYILRDEIDEEGQFAPKEEQEAYNDSLQLLTMFMDIYGND